METTQLEKNFLFLAYSSGLATPKGLLFTQRWISLTMGKSISYTISAAAETYGRNGRLLRDPREYVDRLAVQQRFVLLQLVMVQSVHLPVTSLTRAARSPWPTFREANRLRACLVVWNGE